MDVQIRHDNHIPGDINERLVPVIRDALSRYSSQITTAEVHLADENGPKKSDGDIRCTIEVRVEGRKPTAVTAHANDVYTAVDAATDKLVKKLDSDLGRLRESSGG